ncbi:MAG: Ig-like domain-containing protein [Bacteroidales bacterium]|jgi:uncharacterized protein (DUF2141 family)
MRKYFSSTGSLFRGFRRQKTRFHPSFFFLSPYFCLLPSAFCLLISCAQQGSLTGGAKDEKPPVLVSSVPANFSTHFKSDRFIITFDEFFTLKDIAKQLVISPPMAKKPEIKAKGKVLEIIFKDSLQPDRTYAINFGDALVDLNEGNALKNFQVVFSTGSTIDSLQSSGKVLLVPDNKPAEDILVMLYNGTADSLPLKTIPLYISRTNKEGKFTLRNLAGGSYKIFALKDGNSNLKFDLPSEQVAFLDSLITPSILPPAAIDSVKPIRDSMAVVSDTLKPSKETKDTLPPKPAYRFAPDNIELHLFTEAKPNQYLTGIDRLRMDQIRVKFNERIDSLGFDFLDLPMDSVAVSLEWNGDPDTLDFWIMNPSIAARDSLAAMLVYRAYDSIERPYAKSDTIKLRYRASVKPATAPKKEFSVSASIDRTKTLEFGQPVVFTTTLPYTRVDTSLIRLVTGKDSVARPVSFILFTDTLKGLVMNGVPINQVHPRIVRMIAALSADTSYRLILLPGAFTGMAGQKSDSLDIRFKMKNKDQYGTILLTLPDIKGPVIVELLDARNQVVARRLMNEPGKAVFDLLAPGKYTARLTFDTNGNGCWDTGRYIRHILPEKIITFSKELALKANWEMSETWQWEDL